MNEFNEICITIIYGLMLVVAIIGAGCLVVFFVGGVIDYFRKKGDFDPRSGLRAFDPIKPSVPPVKPIKPRKRKIEKGEKSAIKF